MATRERKLLLVEGQDDLYAVVELMAKHIEWGNSKPAWPVTINAVGSAPEILVPGYIAGQLKSREVEILGILIDANDSFASRWNAIREQCRMAFPGIPDDLPKGGLVLENADSKRVGMWIMPDNSSCGMMETFLRLLIPPDENNLWERARKSVADAVVAGAKCRDCHRDKSNIHTWLAWQDPPGERFGNAILQKILDANSPHVAEFVAWFKRLYQF